MMKRGRHTKMMLVILANVVRPVDRLTVLILGPFFLVHDISL